MMDTVILTEKAKASVAKVYYIRGYTSGLSEGSLSLGTLTIHQSTLWRDIMNLVKLGVHIRIGGLGPGKRGALEMSLSLCSLRQRWGSIQKSPVSVLTKGLLKTALEALEDERICFHEEFHLVSALYDNGCYLISYYCDSNSVVKGVDTTADKCEDKSELGIES